VFENRVLRRIFGPKRDKAIGGWRKLHNDKQYNLYSSPSIISMIKSRRIILIGNVLVASMEEKRMNIGFRCKSQNKLITTKN
jgi:hypothetical protein